MMELPSNNELQRTRHGQDGASPLNSVFDGQDAPFRGAAEGTDEAWP